MEIRRAKKGGQGRRKSNGKIRKKKSQKMEGKLKKGD
jgi:hypothetical protein